MKKLFRKLFFRHKRKISGRWRPFCAICGKRTYRTIRDYKPVYNSVNGKFKELLVYYSIHCLTWVTTNTSYLQSHPKLDLSPATLDGKTGKRVFELFEAIKEANSD